MGRVDEIYWCALRAMKSQDRHVGREWVVGASSVGSMTRV